MKIICPSCGTDCAQTGVFEFREELVFDYYHMKDDIWTSQRSSHCSTSKMHGFSCDICHAKLTDEQDEYLLKVC